MVPSSSFSCAPCAPCPTPSLKLPPPPARSAVPEALPLLPCYRFLLSLRQKKTAQCLFGSQFDESLKCSAGRDPVMSLRRAAPLFVLLLVVSLSLNAGTYSEAAF